ncbi:ATP-binding protein [Candidatus Woesearchaeota archaeon]|nr:ATP-binding protein [Candidatus Woesearchaeota archaeon]
MIIEISIENYLSVKDKVTLSLDSSPSKKLPQNLINLSRDDKLLKSVVIYGANASGKSNIIKSVFFLWNMVRSSHNFNVDTKIPRLPFKLDEIYLEKPSKFEIIFIHKNIKYKYGFSCTNEKIIDEYLFYWPRGREALIFSRKDTTKYEFKSDKRRQDIIKTQTNNNVLYLSRATQLGYEKTKGAYEFIVNNIVINISPLWQDITIKKIFENQDVRKKILEVLKKADFGGIVDVKVDKRKGHLQSVEFKFGKEGPTFNPLKPQEQDVYNVKFQHKTKKGNLIDFEFHEESFGTQKFFSMLGPIFDILESGKVAIIDELESSLHPNIIKFLVKLFNSKYNNNAQLIFTTHNTNLLDNELIRRDQIYICTKEPNKNTILISFLDFDLRETADFERAYLNGRVGGLPFIDETLFD